MDNFLSDKAHPFVKYFRHRKRALFVSTALLGFNLCAWSNALYIHAKAQLAQYLIADAWQQTLEKGGTHYPWSWADTWPLARLQHQPSQTDLFVLAGASGTSLAFGPGHLDGSAQPGHQGTSVIGGHRDTHFAFLEHARIGEELRVQNKQGTWLRYKITELAVKDSSKDALYASPGESELLLITCYPFRAVVPGGPMRYVVKAALTVGSENQNRIY